MRDDSSSHGAARPVLFVEGFSAPGLVEGGGGSVRNIIDKWGSKLSGCKVYMLALNDPNQDLRNNAMIVLGALRYIHNVQTTQLVEGTSVFGYSMGGVLARYALAYAEHWNIAHYCTQFVSLDAPHRGASISRELQEMIWDIKYALDPHNDERINDAMDAIKTVAAKQLSRLNEQAEDWDHGYGIGSKDFLEFYSEINEDERDVYDSTYPDGEQTVVLNTYYDSGYEGQVKPGFPYKQNRIHCLGYSNGGLFLSGNIHSLPHVSRYHLYRLDHPGTFDESYASQDYDCQPGSVIDDMSYDDDTAVHVFHLNQYYAPVIVPTRSSLYLREYSTSGDNPISAFKIDNFSELTAYENEIDTHSYFDKFVYPDVSFSEITELPLYAIVDGVEEEIKVPHREDFGPWNWRHGELGWTGYNYDNWVQTSIDSSDNWLDQMENRALFFIKGTVEDEDLSSVTGTMYINENEYQDITIDADGNYSIPFLYTDDFNVHLEFVKDGCFTEYRDLSIQYNYAQNNDYILPKVYMYELDLFSDLRVCETGDAPFRSINAAIDFVERYIDAGLYVNEPIFIYVQGTFNESVNLSHLASKGITNFTIDGEGRATLAGNGTGHGFFLSVGSDVDFDEAEYKIKRINITGFERGIVYHEYNDVDSYDPVIKLTIDHCNIYGCGASVCTDDGFSAGAIHFEGTGTINGCKFWNNSVSGSDLTNCESYLAGALYLKNNSSNQLVIRNCHFDNNSGGAAGAIMVSGVGKVIIGSNSFNANDATSTFGSVTYIDANDISVCDAPNKILISHNIFKGIQGTSIGLKTSSAQQDESGKDITLTNNTISFDVQDTHFGSVYALKLEITSDPAQQYQSIQCQNNVFMCNHPNICKVSKSSGYHPTVFDHNILHNVTTAQSSFVLNTTDPSQPLYNLMCDPKLDSDLTPIWTATTMSPCIDAGFVEDDDDDPFDIGAVPAVMHSYWTYKFENQYDKDKWYWVSYPVLNTISEDALLASEFFEDLLQVHKNSNDDYTPTYLEEIRWYNQGDYSIIWDNGNWNDLVDTHPVSSHQGYKIKLQTPHNPDFPWPVNLVESGFKTGDNTHFEIRANVENWLGYFKEGSVNATDAFASIWDDIVMVRGKNWSYARVNGYLIGKQGKINYGDMVIIRTNTNHTYQWGTGDITPPETKGAPEKFVFDEKPDYIPVYVSVPDSLKTDLKEIGLYVDGVCKGAVVVEDNLEQISAYVDDASELSEGNVEFVLYYEEGKRQGNELRSLNIRKDRMQAQYGDAGTSYPFFEIKITSEDVDDIVPTEFTLKQNYPNPFNPTTTIAYSLPEASKVRLDIYNVKGQLVKTLVNGDMPAGLHSVVWNGRDSNNAAVASGVYFYRVSSPKATQTKRMLLMK
ncbi:FlgD Ig-like domain protein [anaerobic digester metagenome]